jgi:hypothetical protein
MRFSKCHFVVAVALLAASCSCRGSGGEPVADVFRPPPLELPELAAPKPVSADRILHIFFTSNVAGELDPCG